MNSQLPLAQLSWEGALFYLLVYKGNILDEFMGYANYIILTFWHLHLFSSHAVTYNIV